MEGSCQKFGLRLLQDMTKNDFDQNVIYSPFSIYMALGMTLVGARSSTATQMMETLHWDENQSDLYHQQLSESLKTGNISESENGTLRTVNRLFLEENFTLLESFSETINALYGGGIQQVKFFLEPEKSRKEINSWAEDQTKGKIKDLLPPGTIDPAVRLVLVNAIYFKGSWQDQFSLIGDKDFYLLSGLSKSVPMMRKTSSYRYLNNEAMGFAAVQIPFKMMDRIGFSLLIILPRERGTLDSLEKLIFQHEWNSVLGEDLFEFASVMITLPKFKIECQFKMKDQLKRLGMVIPFTDQADFSGMTGLRNMVIDDVVHKAFIDVDENGVEAAAATAVIMMLRCAPRIPRDPIDFTCDHPFMFALVKNGSMPMFMGHVTKC